MKLFMVYYSIGLIDTETNLQRLFSHVSGLSRTFHYANPTASFSDRRKPSDLLLFSG